MIARRGEIRKASMGDEQWTPEPSFRAVIEQVGPLDFFSLFKPPYVALVGAIIGQRIPYQAARLLRQHLYEMYGASFRPDSLADLSFLPPDKRETILRLNACLASGQPLDLRRLDVPGIGRWTIEAALLSSGQDMDVFPCGDLFLRKRLQRLYGLAGMPTEAEARAMTEKWKPHRGYYAWYLWRWF